jgi:hypothetical protein
MAIKFSVRRSRPECEWGRIYRAAQIRTFLPGTLPECMLLAVVALAWARSDWAFYCWFGRAACAGPPRWGCITLRMCLQAG